LEFGEILNCFEQNRRPENFLLLGMITRASSFGLTNVCTNSVFKHHNKVVLILTIGSYISLVATFTPETVGELEFGEILNCFEQNRRLENFLLLGMITRASSFGLTNVCTNSVFKHHNKAVLILTIGSYIRHCA